MWYSVYMSVLILAVPALLESRSLSAFIINEVIIAVIAALMHTICKLAYVIFYTV